MNVLSAGIVDDPECPRCGYDLAGAVSTINGPAACERDGAACPLTTVCPECGFQSQWADVLRADRRRHPWLFEHARGRWRLWWCAWVTWARALNPWGFWGSVRLHHTVVPKRLVLWAAVMLLPLYLMGVAALIAALWVKTGSLSALWHSLRVMQGSELGWSLFTRPISVIRVDALGIPHLDIGLHWATWFIPFVAFCCAWPAMVMVLPDTRKVAKIRGAHVARAFVYSLAWIPLVWLVHIVESLLGVTDALGITNNLVGNVSWSGGVLGWYKSGLTTYVMFGLFAWISLWWQRVIVSSWRLSRGWVVWVVLMIPTLLCWLIAMVFLSI